MTDREYRAQKARVQRLIRKWHTPLGMRWWRVDVKWSREAAESDAEALDARTAANVCVSWQYLLATITFYLPTVASMGDDELEAAVIHEFCHVLVNEMREYRDGRIEHEERVCTQLANAFRWVWAEGAKEARKGRRR